MERVEALSRLVELRSPLSEALHALAAWPWDSEAPLMTLSASAVCGILRRYLKGELSASDVEAWADAVDLRDDLETESDDVRQAIFELSAPEINYPISADVAEGWIRRLDSN